MESLDYYLSIVQNPYREHNEVTQEDVVEQAEFRFRYDSVVTTIGTPEFKNNYQLFYRELLDEMDDDQELNFFHSCLDNLIEAYHLYPLGDFLNERWQTIDTIKSLTELFEFFENEKWIDLFIKLVPLANPKTLMSMDIRSFLQLHMNVLVKNLEINKEDIPEIVYYNFTLQARPDTLDTFEILISRNKTALISEYYIQRGNIDHD